LKDQYASKRLIYWTISKYAQVKNIQIMQPTSMTNVYEQYTHYLRIYNRRLFDVFCREPYVLDLHIGVDFSVWKDVYDWPLAMEVQQCLYEYMGGKCTVRTTLGQLNFFYWATQQGILAYIKTFEADLMKEMKLDSKERRDHPPTQKKQRQYSKRQRVGNSMIILHRPCTIVV
jgi:hypothetical protein